MLAAVRLKGGLAGARCDWRKGHQSMTSAYCSLVRCDSWWLNNVRCKTGGILIARLGGRQLSRKGEPMVDYQKPRPNIAICRA